jgi:hypothetical protein
METSKLRAQTRQPPEREQELHGARGGEVADVAVQVDLFGDGVGFADEQWMGLVWSMSTE